MRDDANRVYKGCFDANVLRDDSWLIPADEMLTADDPGPANDPSETRV